mmetsp:Transcript_44084/g.104317  ORF Transcript_44084/g.104317 Transcript_44084/m.104317 type:complete len:726 (+) Transcript_44084:140-2317(+)
MILSAIGKSWHSGQSSSTGDVVELLTTSFVVVVLLCVAVPIETLHRALTSQQAISIACALVALRLAWLCFPSSRSPRDLSRSGPVPGVGAGQARTKRYASAGQRHRDPPSRRQPPQAAQPQHAAELPRAICVSAPCFEASNFAEQVDELLGQITPTPEAHEVGDSLAQSVEDAIREIIPEARVVGVVSGDISRGTPYGVAVPEVELIASISVQALARHLAQRPSEAGNPVHALDARKLHKSAIRVCTNHLVSERQGFKFRRSAFCGQEPKVTLMSPLLPRIGKAIPVDFSVNCSTPLYNAALFTECAKLEPRAHDLMLLVKRWAKDRGICYARKGHLPPYAWTLLSVYFLQVHPELALLPPLVCSAKQDADDATLPMSELSVAPKAGTCVAKLQEVRVAELFQSFVAFYLNEVDWITGEVATVRTGKRGNAEVCRLARHMLRTEDGSMEAAPCIEDPFELGRNRGNYVTADGLKRLQEELTRAASLMSSGASLSEILAPWVPAESNLPAEDALLNDQSDGEAAARPLRAAGGRFPHKSAPRGVSEEAISPKLPVGMSKPAQEKRPWHAASAKRLPERTIMAHGVKMPLKPASSRNLSSEGSTQLVKPPPGLPMRREVPVARVGGCPAVPSDRPHEGGAGNATDPMYTVGKKDMKGPAPVAASPSQEHSAHAMSGSSPADSLGADLKAPLVSAKRPVKRAVQTSIASGGAESDLRPWHCKPAKQCS